MVKLIFSLIFFCSMLAGQAQGKIIFITGSCSSGKSSLAKAVAQKIDASYLAFDEYVMPLVLKKMIELETNKVAAFFITPLIKHRFFTLVGFLSDERKYKFEKKFYTHLRNGIAIKPTIKMYQEARRRVLAGEHVVVEAPLHLGDGVDCRSSLSVFDDLDVTYVLAYCPWDRLIERIKTRNATRKKNSHRELDWAIGNFLHYFDISPACADGAIDSLCGSEVRSFVMRYNNSEYKKQRLYILDETRQAALAVFKSDTTRYYLTPKFEYDVIVKKQTADPTFGVDQVVRRIG